MTGSAQIIPFPARSRAPAHPERLAEALGNLAAALKVQRQAVAVWRSALADLGVEVRATETSLLGHLGHLGVLHEGIAKLHENARTLAAWGERHEAASAQPDGAVVLAPLVTAANWESPEMERQATP